MYTYIYAYTYICKYVYIYVCIHIHMYMSALFMIPLTVENVASFFRKSKTRQVLKSQIPSPSILSIT